MGNEEEKNTNEVRTSSTGVCNYHIMTTRDLKYHERDQPCRSQSHFHLNADLFLFFSQDNTYMS